MKRIRKTLHALLSAQTRLRREEDGQIVVFTALAGLALVLMVSTIFNVGMVTGEKMKVQNAADAAAYSQAVWEARVLNFMAYTNRAIICHMVTIAFVTAFESQRQSWERIEMVLTPLSVVPGVVYLRYAATVMRILWTIAARATPVVQKAAHAWIMACKAMQTAVMTEYTLFALPRDRFTKMVATDIDPKIQVNPPLDMGELEIVNGTAAKTLTDVESARLTGVAPSLIPFHDLRDVYINSMDGFSKGESFPRRVNIGGRLVQFQFGLTGNVEVTPNRITQRDGFFFNMIYVPVWGWRIKARFDAAQASYNGLALNNFRMWNDQRAVKRRERDYHPSVYVVTRKDGEDLLQIPLWGAETTQALKAVARAEVFYWDPDRTRSSRLRRFNPRHESNLFNPFWHARLAPVMEGESLSFINLPDLVPITH